MTDWMTSIQKMICTTLSVRVSDFDHDHGDAECDGGAQHDKMPGVDGIEPRTHDDGDADQAEHDRGDTPGIQSFTEEGDRQKCRPDRGR